MPSKKISVLLIEDDPGDTFFIRELLFEKQNQSFDLISVGLLQEGIKQLAENRVDVILLDLTLPDSEGIETFHRVHTQSPEVPIVVLTGLDQEELALKAMQNGAQDYLVKGQVESKLLVKFIRYAIERHTLIKQTEQQRLNQEHERELDSLRRLSGKSPTSITAQSFGVAPLRERQPEIFEELVEHYGDLLDCSLEQRIFKVNHQISEGLRVLAEHIGFLKAGARDVVEIHTAALNRKDEDATYQKVQTYLEEGRLLVLELMGCLVSHYRTYSVGFIGSRSSKGSGQAESLKRGTNNPTEER